MRFSALECHKTSQLKITNQNMTFRIFLTEVGLDGTEHKTRHNFLKRGRKYTHTFFNKKEATGNQLINEALGH